MVRRGEKNNMPEWQLYTIPEQSQIDWLSQFGFCSCVTPPSSDPSRVSSRNWPGLLRKLFSLSLKSDLFLFLSHSILEHLHGKKNTYNSTTCLKLLLLDIFNFKKQMCSIHCVIKTKWHTCIPTS